MKSTVNKVEQSATIRIKAINTCGAVFNIRGTAPLVMNKFSRKAKDQIEDTQAKGGDRGKKKARDKKDFGECYKQAMHISEEGWIGIPASAFRAAAISACRLVGFKMTIAKMSIFIMADGLDADEGTPLVKITSGKPEEYRAHVRNATGVVDLRIRPMWRKWEATLRVNYDGDQFELADVYNLISRVGQQVGLLEGRPDSKMSSGLGFGLFEIVNKK